MISLIKNLYDRYTTIIAEDKYADPRTKDMFLISSPLTVFTLVSGYLYFCLVLGPRLMKDRKPFDLKNVLLVYNAGQILMSMYLVYEGIQIWKHYNWLCEPQDFSDTPLNRRMVRASWLYFINKQTDLLDTVFFVLRKKYNQITFLHVYHHTLLAAGTWICVRYLTGGHGTSFGLLNAMVHIVMYTYYLIAGLGPQYQKYLWWKKHVTTAQLIQFFLIFIHNLVPLFISCSYPKILNIACMTSSGIFVYLFGKFYIQTYITKPKEKMEKKL